MSLYSKITMNDLISVYNQDSIFTVINITIPPLQKLQRLQTFAGCELFHEHGGIYDYFQKLRPLTGKVFMDWIINTEKMDIKQIHEDFVTINEFIIQNCKDLVFVDEICSVLPLAVKHLILKLSETIVYDCTNLMEVLRYY
jgi:hypothetical protein